MLPSQIFITVGSVTEIIGVMMIAWPSVVAVAKSNPGSKLFWLLFEVLPERTRPAGYKKGLRTAIGLVASIDARHKLGPNADSDRKIDWLMNEIITVEKRLSGDLEKAVHRMETKNDSENSRLRDHFEYELGQVKSQVGGVAKYPRVRGPGVFVVLIGIVLTTIGSFLSAGQ